MAKSYTVFPDIVIEGSLQITNDIAQRISDSIKLEENKSAIMTNHGWRTDKFRELGQDLKRLQSLLIQTFFTDIQKNYTATPKMKIELVRPSLLNIKPQHQAHVGFERRRWYSGAIWLQTTNKGSHLQLHAPQSKIYSTPDGVIDYSTIITPKNFKYVFWPSHLDHSFTPNFSFADTVVMQFTITGAVPGVPGPGK